MSNIRILREDKTIYCGVYRITAPNGKEYVGRSKDVLKRWRSYHFPNWQCSGPKLVESIKEFGVDEHIFELVEECCEGDLNKREQYYINLWQTDIKGLNAPKSAFGKKVGFKHTEATKAAMRLAKSRAIGNRSYKGKEFKGHKVCNTQTNEVWKSVSQCARHYGINSRNMDYWLRVGKNNLILM
jgi:group I intron endonuclease